MQNRHMKKQGYKMEYLKILDSTQRSFGQKKSYTIVFIAGGIGYMHQEDDNIVCTMEDLIFIMDRLQLTGQIF